jgi:alcohol dehydrogenase class IV
MARALELAPAEKSDADLAEWFITWIEDLNQRLGIPATVAPLRSDDIPTISRAVLREAHPSYPVPRLMNQANCEALLRRLQSSQEC